jgi:hypothetical protein
MIENLLYVVMGFVITYLSLELAWHCTACGIKDKKITLHVQGNKNNLSSSTPGE